MRKKSILFLAKQVYNSIDTKTPALSSGRVPVESNLVQSLTDTQLRASDVPVSFTRLASGTDSVTIVPSGTQTVSGTVTAIYRDWETISLIPIHFITSILTQQAL